MKITIVYDNETIRDELKNDWGFSCYIDTSTDDKNGNKILFDTGANGDIFLSNMKTLKINPKEIDTVFISHDHWDHTGGLARILDSMDNKKLNTIIYILPSFSQDIKQTIKSKGFLYSEIIDFSEIRDDVYSTGPLHSGDGKYKEIGSIKEQSMMIRTPKGLVIIGGCSHPGIENIVRHVHDWFPKENIYMVFGGFHMLDYSDDEIMNVIKLFKELGVERVMPCHCTGDRAKSIFVREFGNDCLVCGAGKVIDV
ncbi:MBL fold metallo-hydrolase [Candidatus Micrarchaeota archaeon]|nr:MBL fold metallo-hydrolase [Candidatus Micrarchaeota archaeon]